MLVIYGIPNCDTMKKAFDWLNKHKLVYRFHNYKTEGIDEPALLKWFEHFAATEIVNHNSSTYKAMSEKQKKLLEKAATALPVIKEYPSVLKRPLLDAGDFYLLGFDAESWVQELL